MPDMIACCLRRREVETFAAAHGARSAPPAFRVAVFPSATIPIPSMKV